jgi:hypothetical protein
VRVDETATEGEAAGMKARAVVKENDMLLAAPPSGGAAVRRERPILFSAPMVRAILEGRKTQTRRVCTPTAFYSNETRAKRPCPYGHPGDQLWVRETWNCFHDLTDAERTKQDKILRRFQDGKVRDIVAEAMALPVGSGERRAIYAADFGDWAYDPDSDLHWRPSIFMPRWASRITLEITDVRVQRVQEISEEDALAEGVEPLSMTEQEIADLQISDSAPWEKKLAMAMGPGCFSHKFTFQMVWDSINAKRGYGWSANPWVWAVTFRPFDPQPSPARGARTDARLEPASPSASGAESQSRSAVSLDCSTTNNRSLF